MADSNKYRAARRAREPGWKPASGRRRDVVPGRKPGRPKGSTTKKKSAAIQEQLPAVAKNERSGRKPTEGEATGGNEERMLKTPKVEEQGNANVPKEGTRKGLAGIIKRKTSKATARTTKERKWEV
ncbi:unnamed protein product [Amoebophrya sp. A120]|nr:unnamed protein product [Amoebophrya sp. A120]|eukprot:GSA120T00026054001.1